MQVKFSNFYRQVPPPTHFQLHRADELSCLFLSGELFLRMLKALILPLVVPSLITAVGSLDLSLSGKVGHRYSLPSFCPFLPKHFDHLFHDKTDHFHQKLKHFLSPGGRKGSGLLHGNDGSCRCDRNHPRHNNPSRGCRP